MLLIGGELGSGNRQAGKPQVVGMVARCWAPSRKGVAVHPMPVLGLQSQGGRFDVMR